MTIGYWIVTTYLVDRANTSEVALWLSRATFIGPLLMPAILVNFSLVFPSASDSTRRARYLLYIPTIILLLITPTNYIVRDVIRQPEYTEFIYGALYSTFAAYLLGYFLLFFIIIAVRSRSITGLKKIQVRYLFIGLLISVSISVITNVLLPLFEVQELSAIGANSTIFFLGFTAYSIVKHRLLDIRLVLTRSLVYTTTLAAVALAFIFSTFISAQKFGGAGSKIFVPIIVSAIVVFGLDPLKNYLSRITDKFFFKAKIDYQNVLRNISETLNYELDLAKLIKEVRETLSKELKIKNAATLQRRGTEHGTDRFEASAEILDARPQMVLSNSSPLIRYLRQHRHIAILESLERKIEDTPDDRRADLVASKEEFERMGVALVMPIFAQGHLVAILTLGQKLSGDSFGNDDLQLLEVLGPQIGSAIQKANLFQEVKEFSAGLQQKVDAATSELRERNTSLQTLQKITKEITRTLDFAQVTQQIADSVATELGYIGAILVFVDDDGVTVRARAISQTTLTAKALSLLPRSFTSFTSRLDSPEEHNLAHQVLQHGEIIMTRSMPQVISPPMPKLLAFEIQKILKIKTLVLVPIVSEGKTIGCIEIGVQKPQEEISRSEIDTMQSLADELGVVARNLSLFGAIQRTNQQLEDANKHLKALDQAKSEFVSIASHQLRTPMTGIKGYLSMLTDGDFGKMEEKHVEILRQLLAESERMIRLINQFLNVSKIEAGKFSYQRQPVDISDLVAREVRELKKNAEDKKLKILYEAPVGKFPITVADGDKLQDVILNLIDNAIKYTASGTIHVSLSASDKNISVAVKDSGIGIKSSDAPELFNKFVRGSGIAQIHPDGSGLGLFIAKSIIDAHGGKIWAESDGEGQGSTFKFTVPIIQPNTDSTPTS